MEVTIPVYAVDELSPRAAEVLRSIVDAEFPDQDIKFRMGRLTDARVLVFGRAPDFANGKQEYVYTYSIPQMMSKANAASVIRAGVQQMLGVPEEVPFRKPLGTSFVANIGNLDFDRPIAIDIETDGNLGKEHTPEEINIISVAVYQPGGPKPFQAPMVLIGGGSWHGEKREPLSIHQIADLREILPKFKYAIYHNGKFDVRVLNRVLGVKLCVWFDTMLAHHSLNHAAGDHKLKTLARRYLGAPEWEEGLGKYTKGGGHYENIPTEELIAYNGWDVYWTYKLYEFLGPQLMADEAAQRCVQLELAAANFLLDVETYGIPMDTDYATVYSESLTLQATAKLRTLRNHLGMPEFNPNSPKQVQKVLNHYGVFVPSTNEETLRELMDTFQPDSKVHQFCKALLEIRKLNKINGTYAKGWMSKQRDGRVHPTFLVHGTSTGRLSSTSPNAQNMPREKEIRKLVRTHG